MPAFQTYQDWVIVATDAHTNQLITELDSLFGTRVDARTKLISFKWNERGIPRGNGILTAHQLLDGGKPVRGVRPHRLLAKTTIFPHPEPRWLPALAAAERRTAKEQVLHNWFLSCWRKAKGHRMPFVSVVSRDRSGYLESFKCAGLDHTFWARTLKRARARLECR